MKMLTNLKLGRIPHSVANGARIVNIILGNNDNDLEFVLVPLNTALITFKTRNQRLCQTREDEPLGRVSAILRMGLTIAFKALKLILTMPNNNICRGQLLNQVCQHLLSSATSRKPDLMEDSTGFHLFPDLPPNGASLEPVACHPPIKIEQTQYTSSGLELCHTSKSKNASGD